VTPAPRCLPPRASLGPPCAGPPCGFPRLACAGLLLSLLLAAGAAAEDPANLIQMPFKRGDTAFVHTDDAEFFTHDRRLIARLPRGTRVDVAKAEIAWVGGYIEQDGRRRMGWIRSGYLAKSLPEDGAPDDAAGKLPR